MEGFVKSDPSHSPLRAYTYTILLKFLSQVLTCFPSPDADIEHVTIEFRRGPQQGQQQQGQPSQSSQQGQQESPSASGYRPSRMFFAAHTWMEGEWVDFGRVERDRDEPTRPVAYVARHGHGHVSRERDSVPLVCCLE